LADLIYLLNTLLVFSTVFLTCILSASVTPRMAVSCLVLEGKELAPLGCLNVYAGPERFGCTLQYTLSNKILEMMLIVWICSWSKRRHKRAHN